VREHAIMEENFFCAVNARAIQQGLVVQLSQLRVEVVRSEKLVAEARDSSEIQRKGNVRWLWLVKTQKTSCVQ
jgi:hypothetical protein